MVKKLEAVSPPVVPAVASLSPGWLAAWGVLCGWLALRFLAFSGGVEFLPPVQVEGIRNYCAKLGYPKQRDYFWFVAVMLSAWGGAGLAAGLRMLLRWSGWRGLARGWTASAGLACLAAAFVLSWPSATGIPALPLFLACLGFALPWLDRRWMEDGREAEPDPEPGGSGRRALMWALVAAPLVFLVVRDPAMAWRNIDGIHEGAHLLYVQSALAGDTPGVVVRAEYAPLYLRSLSAWMSLFGITMSSERWYFQAVQMLGAFIHILALAWVCRTRLGAFAGFWGMLLLTIAPYTLYGATNSLRTALPFAALIVFWRGLDGGRILVVAASGVLLGVAGLYSQEYAITTLLAGMAMLGAMALRDGWRKAAGPLLAWAGCALAASILLMLAIFGSRMGEAFSFMLSGGYAASRLYGHGARPFPVVPWLGDFSAVWKVRWNIFENMFLWWPAFLAGGVGAWLVSTGRSSLSGRRLLAIGLIVSGIATFIPALVRPMGSMAIAGTLVPMLGLAALAVDWMWERQGAGRIGAVVMAGFLAVFGVVRVYMFARDISTKWEYAFNRTVVKERLLERLGGIMVNRPQEEGLLFLAKKIQEWCPRDRRIYMAAPSYNHLLFLADRAGLPPYPTATVAASAPARKAMVEALEREKPPLALITSLGVDIPFEEEHAEEWAYIQKYYRLAASVESLKIYRRK